MLPAPSDPEIASPVADPLLRRSSSRMRAAAAASALALTMPLAFAVPASVGAPTAPTRTVYAAAMRSVLTADAGFDRPSSDAMDVFSVELSERSMVRASRDSARVVPNFDRPSTAAVTAVRTALVARPRPAPAASSARKRSGQVQKPRPERTKVVWRERWVRPGNGRFTSGFKQRWGRMHRGIDLAAPYGSPIVAAAAGVVVFAGPTGGYGKLVLIRHGGGIVTAYGHMKKITVSMGETVSAGERIALVGSEGRSTGPHLHFEVRQNGVHINPLPFLAKRQVFV